MKYAKFLIVILFCIFINPLCFSETESEYFKMVDENFSKAVLPLFFEKGLPIVEVKIQDKLFRLILDTGADYATIQLRPHALKEINVKYFENEKKSLDVFGNSYQNRLFEIPELQIGNLRFKNFIAGEELRSFVPVDGIIGNRFLKNFFVLVDYQGAKIVLYPKKEYPSELRLKKWEKINFEHSNIGIIVSVKIDAFDRELKFCLDSGSGSSGNKKHGLLRSNNLEDISKDIGRLVNYDHVCIDGIELGRVDFFVVDFKEPPVDGFFGDYFFSKFKTLIYFDREILFVKKY